MDTLHLEETVLMDGSFTDLLGVLLIVKNKFVYEQVSISEQLELVAIKTQIYKAP